MPTQRGVGIASLPVETLIYQIGTDPAKGVPATSVGDRVHKSPVPDDYGYPFLTYYRRGAQDIGPIGRNAPSTVSMLTYEVKAVDIGFSSENIEETAQIMDAELDGLSTSIFVEDHWYDISVRRTSELQVELPPEEDGTVFQQLGGIYEFYVARVT